MLAVIDSIAGVEMSSTTIILLVLWLGLNLAFLAVRLYIIAHRRPRETRDASGYPRLVN